MSFLITAPETGADSILITNAFFGFLTAVARPVISFITAVVAGIFCIGLIRDRPAPHDHDHDDHDHRGHDHDGHDHAVHEPLMPGSDDCYVRPSELKAALIGWARRTTHGASEYARWLSYPIMVLVGVPLYICASASTPIAAALVARGVSPGAALIFLMTGPATNTGTIAIIANQFGARFASV